MHTLEQQLFFLRLRRMSMICTDIQGSRAASKKLGVDWTGHILTSAWILKGDAKMAQFQNQPMVFETRACLLLLFSLVPQERQPSNKGHRTRSNGFQSWLRRGRK